VRVLGRSEQLWIFELMTESVGVLGIARVTGISPTTIRRHLCRWGEALLDFHNRMVRDVSLTRLECDETWSWVYAKSRRNVRPNSKKVPPLTKVGEFYIWTVIDPDTKLFVDWRVGKRSRADGRKFMMALSKKVIGDLMLTTDAFKTYREVIDDAFGTRATHVELKKKMRGNWDRESGNRETTVYGITKSVRGRKVAYLPSACTGHIERLHATMRNFNSRLARKTYKFSKRLENHVYAQAIFGAFYNFTRQHGGLKGKHRNWTPAMAAGLTNKIWSPDDLLNEVDAYWRAREAEGSQHVQKIGRAIGPQPLSGMSSKPYFVLHRAIPHEAKVHRGSCRLCRQGQGMRERPGSGKHPWYEFDDLAEARKHARRLEPGRASDCAMCMKEMQPRLGRRI
jgi:IS1 family transposase